MKTKFIGINSALITAAQNRLFDILKIALSNAFSWKNGWNFKTAHFTAFSCKENVVG